MRTPALPALVAILACGALVGALLTSTSSGVDADAASVPATVTHYRDPAQLNRPQIDVVGTLLTVDYDVARHADGHAVRLAGGRLLPVALKTSFVRTIAFDGSLAISPALAKKLAKRGVHVSGKQHLDSSTAQGRTAIAVAEAEATPLPVSVASLTTPTRTAPQARTAPTVASTPASKRPAAAKASATNGVRLYAAVITNRGSIKQSRATIGKYLDAMRSYWQTEAGGSISFTQPSATVYYASSAAASTSSGCGMGDPTTIWNEAAAKFRGVDFDAPGNHLAVVLSGDCAGPAGAGVGTIGDDMTSAGDTVVSLSDASVAIGVHELGHNFSLEHSNAQRCSGSSCTTVYYYDVYSIMGLAVAGGGWTPPALDTARRVQLGLADSSEAPNVLRPATVHIANRGASSGVRGFVVTDPAGGTQYAVDYRAGTNRDSSAFYRSSNATLRPYIYRPGVVVERLEDDGSTTLMTRASGSSYLTSLAAGQSLTVGTVTLKVLKASPSDGADVQVTMTAASKAKKSAAPTAHK